MKPRTRIPARRQKPRRKRPELFIRRKRDMRFLDSRSHVTKGGRVRLFGKDYENLRVAAYIRSRGNGPVPHCECGCGRLAWWSGDRSWPDTGDFAHNEHGGRKSDELHRGKWLRHECHMKSHNCGGKPIPRKVA